MIYVVVFCSIILATVFLSRALERKSILNSVISRKILHVVAIGLSALSVFYIDIVVLQIITASCLPFLLFIVSKGFFRDPQTKRRSWGIVYFNLVFTVLVYIFPQAPALVFFPLMILALGDGLAAIAGVSLAKKKGKSFYGFLAFFLSSHAVFILSPKVFPVPDLPIETAFILSLALASIEFITKRSIDNLTVPLAALYWLLVDHLSSDYIPLIFAGIAIGAWIIYKLKWLDLDGSILAAIIALVYLSSPFPEALIPGFIFFATGSVLSKIPGGNPAESARNAMQVFSNGGPALFAIGLFYTTGQSAWLLASIVSFSAALSDTVSSELGTRFSSRTFDILGLRKLKKGTSGGVSLAGFLFGIIASGFLALTTSVFIDLSVEEISIIWVFGFLGNLTDSVVGSLVQSKSFQVSSGMWIDQERAQKGPHAGLSWFDNNLTNLFSIAMVTILSYFVF